MTASTAFGVPVGGEIFCSYCRSSGAKCARKGLLGSTVLACCDQCLVTPLGSHWARALKSSPPTASVRVLPPWRKDKGTRDFRQAALGCVSFEKIFLRKIFIVAQIGLKLLV